MIRLKRVYEPAEEEDGECFLVERLWPRGVSKEDAHISGWLRALAPSPELRQWFGHDPAKWDEFRARYAAELRAAEKQGLLRELAEKARTSTITFVYAARDSEHNNALALKEFIERHYLTEEGTNG
jgi:uncharacterized protein YeaO (DUF488 family)